MEGGIAMNPKWHVAIRALLLGGVLVSLTAGDAWCGGKGNSHANKGATVDSGTDGAIEIGVSLITATERSIISNYIQTNPGFAQAQPLPPGIAKKIARGGTMPPGIAKRYFPNDLMARLPPRPGQQWIVAGTDILLVNSATQLVVDILSNAF
jgi:hypothetical protein